jgi:hypothetical protein
MSFRKMKQNLALLKVKSGPQQPSAVPAPQTSLPIPARSPIRKLEPLTADQFPPLFEEFHTKCFNLLWRGNSDNFTAAAATDARTL